MQAMTTTQGHSQAGQLDCPAGSFGIQRGAASLATPYASQIFSQPSFGQSYGQQIISVAGKSAGSEEAAIGAGGLSGGIMSDVYGWDTKFPSAGFGAAGASSGAFNQKADQHNAVRQYSKLSTDGPYDALKCYSESQLLWTTLHQGAALDIGVRSQSEHYSSGRSSTITTATDCSLLSGRDVSMFQVGGPRKSAGVEYSAMIDSIQAADLGLQIMEWTDEQYVVPFLKSFSYSKMFEHGHELHQPIIERGLESDPYLLIDKNTESEDFEKTEGTFELAPFRMAETWNALMSCCNHQMKGPEGLQLFKRMQQEGVEPSRVTFLCALKACSIAVDLSEGKRIHVFLIENGLEFAMFVENALIDMYVSCASLDDACAVFARSHKPDVISYNTLIGGYAEDGDFESALFLFTSMQERGIPYDKITFICILKACCSSDHLHYVQQIHASAVECGLEFIETLGNSLVHSYICCESFEDAKKLFQRLGSQSVVTWTTLIAGYTRTGRDFEALEILGHMRHQGVEPNEVTYVSIIKGCINLLVVESGESVHVKLIEEGYEGSLCIGNALIDMYGKFGQLEEAATLFLRMPFRNVITWTALISGYSQQGHASEALSILDRMQDEGFNPNSVTFAALLNACTNKDALHQGRYIHACIVEHGLENDTYVGNSIVDMYFGCQSLDDGREAFNKLPHRGVVTWNILISGYVQHGQYLQALSAYHQMHSELLVQPDSVTFVCTLKACLCLKNETQGIWVHAHIVSNNYLINTVVGNGLVEMYAKFGRIEDAYRVFNTMPKQNIVTWNVLLTGLLDTGHGNKTLELYSLMQESNLKPDAVSLLCSIKACSSIGALQYGQALHIQITWLGFDTDLSFVNSLISMYSSCGSMSEAQLMFDKLPMPDVISWSILISGYGQYKRCQDALSCYEKMLQSGFHPDQITFGCLLSACSRGGFLDEGFRHFKTLRDRWGLQPTVEHYNPLIDLLGGAGALQEAEDLLETIPFERNTAGWVILLSATKENLNEIAARRCFDRIVGIDSGNASAYLIMSSIYIRAGQYHEAQNVEELRKLANAWKKPAKAFIEIDSQVHEFVVGDKTHPQKDAIYSKLKSLDIQLKKVGYCSKFDSVISFSENEEEKTLCSHSEKLAIAFGLISSSPFTTLRISKNIRMCDDCHVVTKLISKIETRSIILKDSYCIHQFENGLCSCENQGLWVKDPHSSLSCV